MRQAQAAEEEGVVRAVKMIVPPERSDLKIKESPVADPASLSF